MFNETFDPEIDNVTLCSKLIKEQISFVSVELASKTFMRSITDQQINFLGQLSSLGTNRMQVDHVIAYFK